jgi:hypothetical protein
MKRLVVALCLVVLSGGCGGTETVETENKQQPIAGTPGAGDTDVCECSGCCPPPKKPGPPIVQAIPGLPPGLGARAGTTEPDLAID